MSVQSQTLHKLESCFSLDTLDFQNANRSLFSYYSFQLGWAAWRDQKKDEGVLGDVTGRH